MYLKEIEAHQGEGAFAEAIAAMQSQGTPVPQILHLFSFKPSWTRHLAAFTQELMRGPSPLSAGLRELIAAFTSSSNRCPF
jgi:alkylhydroperoxidase family enzyme